MLTPSPCAAHLVLFKISVGRDLKILTTAAMVENSALSPNGRNSIVCLHGPMSTFNSLFQNPQILRTISSGHDVVHTPSEFPVWGLLCDFIGLCCLFASSQCQKKARFLQLNFWCRKSWHPNVSEPYNS